MTLFYPGTKFLKFVPFIGRNRRRELSNHFLLAPTKYTLGSGTPDRHIVLEVESHNRKWGRIDHRPYILVGFSETVLGMDQFCNITGAAHRSDNVAIFIAQGKLRRRHPKFTAAKRGYKLDFIDEGLARLNNFLFIGESIPGM